MGAVERGKMRQEGILSSTSKKCPTLTERSELCDTNSLVLSTSHFSDWTPLLETLQ